jgi:hypothetical protein
LRAQLRIESNSVPDAWLAPAIFIGHNQADGSSYILAGPAGAGAQPIPIDVGPADGVVRVVKGEALSEELTLELIEEDRP